MKSLRHQGHGSLGVFLRKAGKLNNAKHELHEQYCYVCDLEFCPWGEPVTGPEVNWDIMLKEHVSEFV